MMISIDNSNLLNQQAIKEEVMNAINSFKDWVDYRLFGYAFNEMQDCNDYGVPCIYLNVDMITPESYQIRISIIDEIYQYNRKVDDKWMKFFKGDFDGRSMNALSRICDNAVSNIDGLTTLLQEITSISVGDIYGTQLVYDCEIVTMLGD